LAPFFFLHVINRQQNFYIDNLIKMPGNSIHLAGHVAAQGGGNFKMVAADRQIHKETPFPWLDEGLKTPTGTSGKAADGQLSWFHYAPEAGQTQSGGARKSETSLTGMTPVSPPTLRSRRLVIDLHEFFDTFTVFGRRSDAEVAVKIANRVMQGSAISSTRLHAQRMNPRLSPGGAADGSARRHVA
jgi:hypothetical protein